MPLLPRLVEMTHHNQLTLVDISFIRRLIVLDRRFELRYLNLVRVGGNIVLSLWQNAPSPLLGLQYCPSPSSSVLPFKFQSRTFALTGIEGGGGCRKGLTTGVGGCWLHLAFDGCGGADDGPRQCCCCCSYLRPVLVNVQYISCRANNDLS